MIGRENVEDVPQASHPDSPIVHGRPQVMWILFQHQVGPGKYLLFFLLIPEECFSSKEQIIKIALKIFRFDCKQPTVSSRVIGDQFRFLSILGLNAGDHVVITQKGLKNGSRIKVPER